MLLALGLGALALAASTGFIANRVFAQPTTLKYLVTVFAPLLLIVACLSKQPLRLLVGAAIVASPWNFNATFGGLKLAPVTALLGLALLVALLESRDSARRATASGSVVVVAVALLLPSLAIGRELSHYLTWIVSTLVAGWLAFKLVQRPNGLRFLISAIVAAAAVEAFVAFFEYTRHANLNLYSSEVKQTVSQSYFFNFGKDFRPAGTLPDPNSLGNVLALACPLALVLLLSAPSRISRLGWAVCALAITVALTLSFSRASWIGAVAGIGVALIALPARLRLPAAGGICALLLLTVAVGLSVGGASLDERFTSIGDPTARINRTAKGDEERRQIWSAALASASANPVVGTGTGRLQEHLSEHLRASPEGLHAQSVYFQFLAQSGILGLLALLLLVGHAVSGVLAGLRGKRLLLAGVGGAIVAMLITWATDTSARYTSVSVLLAFLLGAAMAQHWRPHRRGRGLVEIAP